MFPEKRTTPGLRIVSGDETRQHVGWLKTWDMARLVADSLHDTPPIALPRLRSACRFAIRNILPQTIVDAVYPYPTDWEARLVIMDDIRRMIRQRSLLAALLDRTIVGIAGYERISDDRNVIELRRTVVDPAYRGRGVYALLADTRLREIGEKAPDFDLINATRQPSVIRWSEKNRFSEIAWQRFWKELKKIQFSAAQEKSFDDRVQRFGWKYFLREAGK